MGILRRGNELHCFNQDFHTDLSDGRGSLHGKQCVRPNISRSSRANVPKIEDSVPRIGRWIRARERLESRSSCCAIKGVLRVKLDFLTFFVSAFACYRVTVLISRDVGPFGICKKAREHSKLLKCPYCTSVYVGSLTALVLWISGFVMPFGMWFILSLAFAGATIVLDRCFSADYQP